MIAFVSDREEKGDFQLYLLDPISGASKSAPRVDGWIEYLRWSNDGSQILLAVAGHASDNAGAHGGVEGVASSPGAESWIPEVETGDDNGRRRSSWIYHVGLNTVEQVSPTELNVWEVDWCGPAALVAVGSARSEEGAWYGASLHVIDVEQKISREIYKSQDQLGWPSASPSGRHVAVVEAVCSDRWCVAGELLLIDVASSSLTRVPTNEADICHTKWRGNHRILLGAHRGFDSLVMEFDLTSQVLTESWASREIAATGNYVHPVPCGEGVGDCVFLAEGYRQAPTVAVIEGGNYRAVRNFGRTAESRVHDWLRSTEPITWRAPDGTEIEGWLLLPKGAGPFPLVMCVHGGPISSVRPHWSGRFGITLTNTMLLKRGYAIFQPNPRGSSGRGQAFARKVKGDINGADALDCLSGLDILVARGVADPHRIGVTGGSYGGNMACWLVTQDQRFAAAVAVAPHCDQVSQHLMSNIPEFDEMFIGEKYSSPNGKYYERSPIMHAHKARTPTLCIAGALDRSTPANQAIEFHNALRMHGVKSALAIYPEEGHGIRNFPAMLDCAARAVSWFEEHMGAAFQPAIGTA